MCEETSILGTVTAVVTPTLFANYTHHVMTNSNIAFIAHNCHLFKLVP